MKRWHALFIAAVSFGGTLPLHSDSPAVKPVPSGKIQYARDILPILSANCFVCHGPDEKTRKAKLRLDLYETATMKLRGGTRAVVPGDAQKSELVTRIHASGEEQMPPVGSKKQLSEAEKQQLKRWIDEGAEYQKHWAFTRPQRPTVPLAKGSGWAKNPIDHFVLARLENEGLKPSPEADRYTLARRVALDLTGLPPSLEAVDRFVNDKSADAYEKFVDEVLRAPTFGERWAHVWLDLARYADSNGYATDNLRTIWKYRDWVIDALNANMPFDRFTTLQLAGDLLPGATGEQILPTAFHRNTLTNDEGGTSDEEFRSAAVVDRVNTTMQVWMGVTMACAQCHDHKYDPLSQEEYFRLYAIFNQTEDADRGDNAPLFTTISPEDAKQKAKLEGEVATLDKQLKESDAGLAKWEKELKADKLPANIQAVLKIEAAKRNAAQKTELTKFYRSTIADLKVKDEQVTALKKQIAGISAVTTPIMKDLPEKQRRVTKIHVRGNFLDQSKEVTPGVPALFAPLSKEQPPDRLALAKWLVDPANPLTARVAVNRFWEQLLGTGLMDTPDDFGIRGKLPNHPELLDWLATEFVEQKWDVKKLLRLIVTSATYRQSSAMTPALIERDPENKLFARGPRYRASAEVIRDQALAVSGLLSLKMYGAPVRPPRPKVGLTAAFGGGTDWETSPGEDKYRRGLYIQWRRTMPYASMVTFDAPSRNVCAVTRPRTNTPLQALVTLNDPVYVEAAQALGRRMLKEGGQTVDSRLRHGFRLCLTRPPHENELKRLVELFERARTEYAKNLPEAQKLATDPLGPLPAGTNAAELAAYTVIGNVLLNLDETFAKR